MKKEKTTAELLAHIRELESRLEESEQLIESIKAGEVDAFAIRNGNGSEVYTLQTGDYAYRVLVEEFGEGAINVTEEGLIVYSNACFTEILQLPYENIVGSFITRFIHPDSLKEFKQLFAEAHHGRAKGEICLVFNDRQVPVYISMTSLQPKLPTVGMIVTDLSQKKAQERMIMEYQRSLETKNAELLRSNAELASFAYVASHDLQEPLRKIGMFAGRILEKEYASLSVNAKDYFDRMQQAAQRMQTLIEDLLAYSRTNTVERVFEPTRLDEIITEVERELKEELQQKKAVIQKGEMCQVNLIPFQFRQLLHNLINNSLKFAHPDRSPVITITSEIIKGSTLRSILPADKAKYCHIRISDNGIGFEQQYSHRIFEIFQRLHGRTQYKGTGIGLSIVKKIVENHLGFITAESKIDQGAAFDIYLPA